MNMSGSAGCDQYHATIIDKDGAVPISGPKATLMSCQPVVILEESQFLKNLDHIVYYNNFSGTNNLTAPPIPSEPVMYEESMQKSRLNQEKSLVDILKGTIGYEIRNEHVIMTDNNRKSITA